MERKPAYRGLDRVARDLLAPFLAGRFAASGWELISWDDEQAIFMNPAGLAGLHETKIKPATLDLEVSTDPIAHRSAESR